MSTSNHALNTALFLRKVKRLSKKSYYLTHHYFQRTEIAAAILATISGTLLLPETAHSDEFTQIQDQAVLQDLSENISLENLDGPYKFTYVENAPERVGYLYAPDTY